MRWTERQRAMLREMGISLWPRPGDAAAGDIAVDDDDPATSSAAGAAERRAAHAAATSPRPRMAEEPGVAHAHAERRVQPVAAMEQVAGVTDVERADWFFVGDALDAATDAGGAQARLLDNMLRAIGLSRDDTNVAARAAYAPLAAEADRASAGRALEGRLAAARPRCIVALGRGAAQALLDRAEPLGSLRGQVHARGATPVVVTFALSYLLRHPEDKAKAWADLCLAVQARDAAASVA